MFPPEARRQASVERTPSSAAFAAPSLSTSGRPPTLRGAPCFASLAKRGNHGPPGYGQTPPASLALYPALDKRVSDTYAADSTATNRMGLSDPYVKAIRWASDRIGDEGVVAFITNDSFLNSVMADGMRLHLAKDFDLLYILDLGGNVRINPRLSGTTHNVFGIQVGVSINFLVRSKRLRPSEGSTILHYATDGFWRKEQKFSFLDEVGTIANVKWARLRPDENNNWLTQGLRSDYDSLIPLGIKSSKSGAGRVEAVFDLYSNGNDSGRDDWVYNHDLAALQRSVQLFVDTYNS